MNIHNTKVGGHFIRRRGSSGGRKGAKERERGWVQAKHSDMYVLVHESLLIKPVVLDSKQNYLTSMSR